MQLISCPRNPGGGAAVQLVTLTGITTLTASDILVL
jgi:hypothetical protein